MYFRKAMLVLRDEHVGGPGPRSHYLGVRIRLTMQCPACRCVRIFVTKPGMASKFQEDRGSYHSLQLCETFACKACGTLSRLPESHQRRAMRAITLKAFDQVMQQWQESNAQVA